MSFKAFREIKEKSNYNNQSTTTPPKERKSTLTKLPFTNIRVDRELGKVYPIAAKFLHSYDSSVDLSIHKVYDPQTGLQNMLCEEHWKDKCQFCLKKNIAKSVKCLITYAVSLVGKEWNVNNKTGAYQLVRIAAVPLGKNKVNLESMLTAHREKIFMDRLWLFTKTKQKIKDNDAYVTNPPKILYPEDYSSVIGSALPDYSLNESASRILKMDKDEIFLLIVSSFDNGQDLIDVINKEEEEISNKEATMSAQSYNPPGYGDELDDLI